MKKKFFILLACIYILAAGTIIVLTLNTVYLYTHERTALGQDNETEDDDQVR